MSVASERRRTEVRHLSMTDADIFQLKKRVLDLENENERLRTELEHKTSLLEEEALRSTLLEEELSL